MMIVDEISGHNTRESNAKLAQSLSGQRLYTNGTRCFPSGKRYVHVMIDSFVANSRQAVSA